MDRMLELIKKRGMTQKQFAEQLKIRPQAITEWKQGITSSYTDRLPQIAAILNTTTDYLLTGKKDGPTTVSDDVDTSCTKPEIILQLEQLSPKSREEVLDFIRFKLSQEKSDC